MLFTLCDRDAELPLIKNCLSISIPLFVAQRIYFVSKLRTDYYYPVSVEKVNRRSFVVFLYILKRRPPRCLPPYHLATRIRQFTAFMFLITSRMQFPEPDSPPSFFSSEPSLRRIAQLKWLAFFILNRMDSAFTAAE